MVDPTVHTARARCCEYDPRSNRACGFPAHGLPRGIRSATLRGHRVPNRPAQAMKTERVKKVGRPSSGLTGSQIAAVALHEQALQPPRDIVIDLPKLDGGIARAEVRPPAAEHRVEPRDGLAQVLVAHRAWRQRLHALLDPAHRALGRPPLEEVHALVPLLPDGAAHALAQVTAEEVESRASAREVDVPRLFRV